MFVHHASFAQKLAQCCTSALAPRSGVVEAGCGIRQATKQPSCPFTRTQIYRFHSPPTVRGTGNPKFSSGDDVTLLGTALQNLLRSAKTGGRWILTSNGQGLERSFKFKNFTKTWDFMTAVSLQCKLINHHPEWSNVYNTTYIRWTTHNPPGLSAKDIRLAEICDALASDFQEIVDVDDDNNSNNNEANVNVNADADAKIDQSASLRQVADRVADAAGRECCGLDRNT